MMREVTQEHCPIQHDQTNDPDALFIPLVSDYGFKVVFGNERNTLFLRRALRALIQSEVLIREVSFDKNTFDAVVKDSRGGILTWSV